MSEPQECTKTKYDTYTQARRAITGIKYYCRNDSLEKPVRVYQCKYCGGFHITSDGDRENNQFQRKRIKRAKAIPQKSVNPNLIDWRY